MTKTVKSVIGEYNIQKLNQKNEELHKIGTPRVFIEAIKAAIQRYTDGDFQVNRMNKKYLVADVEVTNVYVTTAITYNWALPARGDEVSTEVLFLQTKDGGYYYDHFTNTLGATLKELNLKEGSIGSWKPFILTDEAEEPSGYYEISYTTSNSPILTTVVYTKANLKRVGINFKRKYPNVNVIQVEYLTKAQATNRGLF